MADKVKPIPEGYNTMTTYFIVNDGDEFIDFIKDAFGAEEKFRMNYENGKVSHAEFKLGNSMLMVSEGNNEHPPMTCMTQLYVENCDEVFNKAVKAGGQVVREMADQFYGDRSGGVKDPCGNQWWISTHIKDVSMEELEEAAKSSTEGSNKK